MASVLQVAAAVVDLINFSRQCLDLYQEARTNTSGTHNELRLRLEVEAIRFDRWCDAVGVKEMVDRSRLRPQDWDKAEEMMTWSKHLQKTLHFDSQPIGSLILGVLEDLRTKFEAARERLPQSTSSPEMAVSVSPRKRLSWKRTAPKGLSQSRTIVLRARQTSGDLVAAGKFLLWDKKVFDRLLSDVTAINETLLKLVGIDIQAQIERRVAIVSLGAPLRNDIPTQPGTLPSNHGDIMRLSQLRARIDGSLEAGTNRIAARRDGSNISDHSLTRIPRFHAPDFGRETLAPRASRSASTLGGSDVLVEWRYFSGSQALGFDQGLRLAALVTELGRNHFHVPSCRGFVKDDENHRVGLVFDVPDAVRGGKWTHRDLQSIIRDRSLPMPPIGQRFALARRLAISLLQFQSVHWLHKSLRSDNIVCFERDKPSADTNGTSLGGEATDGVGGIHDPPGMRPLPCFYLLGLDISRPDHASELSESVSVSKSGYRARHDEVELYRHPDVSTFNEDGSRARYRSEYDIYSLGLILLEIGLWRTLGSLKKESGSGLSEFRGRTKTVLCDQVMCDMGEIYWRVTKRCLCNDFDLDDNPVGVDSGTPLQLAFEKQVVSEVERCIA